MKTASGIAIALAWPQTYCKQPGSWYDPIAKLLGISRNNYYRVGHAALVLIENSTQICHYFDFGRYHAPYGHGRVRSALTDHELTIHTRATISKDGTQLTNYNEVLEEIQANSACHGDGVLHASYHPIDFCKAFGQAVRMQKNSPIPYGPFILHGTNCSRFVNTVIYVGLKNYFKKKSFKFGVLLTPTPMNNVRSLNNVTKLFKKDQNNVPLPAKLSNQDLISTLRPPSIHKNIPENSQWLSGEGAGSWFHVKILNNKIWMERYSPYGILECSGEYAPKDNKAIKQPSKFEVLYPSNCQKVIIKDIEKESVYKFVKIQ